MIQDLWEEHVLLLFVPKIGGALATPVSPGSKVLRDKHIVTESFIQKGTWQWIAFFRAYLVTISKVLFQITLETCVIYFRLTLRLFGQCCLQIFVTYQDLIRDSLILSQMIESLGGLDYLLNNSTSLGTIVSFSSLMYFIAGQKTDYFVYLNSSRLWSVLSYQSQFPCGQQVSR